MVDVIAEEKDEQMVEFAMGGICNCCLDRQNMAYLLENDCIQFTVKCLSRCASVATLYCAPLFVSIVVAAIERALY